MSDSEGRARAALPRHSVVLIDPELAMHEFGRRVLEFDPRIRVIGGGVTLAAGLELVGLSPPDVVVLDPLVSDESPEVQVHRIRQEVPHAVIVLFSRALPTPVPAGVAAATAKANLPALLDAVLGALGVEHLAIVDVPCPRCGGSLVVTVVLLDEAARELVCGSCMGVYRQEAGGPVVTIGSLRRT